jgi:molecular chaperone DnaK
MASGNRALAKFNLDGIPPAPRGVPQVEVAFDIDADGILHVTATDKATNKEHKVRVEASSGLSDSDIERAVVDAEANAEDDEKRREHADLRNTLDSFVYQTEKTFKEHGDKLASEDRQALDEGLAKAKAAVEQDDFEAMQAAQEHLQSVAYRLSEAMYKGANADAPGPGDSDDMQGGPPADEGDVIDAEEVGT